jgi:hypothetical protein
MSKTIYIKLKSSSIKAGPFKVTDAQNGDVIAALVSRNELIAGRAYVVGDTVSIVTIDSLGKCKNKRNFNVGITYPSEIASTIFVPSSNACIWRHLKNPVVYNFFYGNVEPYIIEYPFAYQYQDEILQNVKDYSKVYRYLPDTDFVSDECDKIAVDNVWFNKAVVYNDQQSSGLLELVPKPINNLSAYLQYPKYNVDSKTITYTKSDNFYQYNTFWSLVKDKALPLFLRSCESLSIDKIINQANMNYTTMSFKKEPFRAKDLKIRHILDNNSEIHIVSQFLVTPSQISYK